MPADYEETLVKRFNSYCRKAIDHAANEAYKFIRKNAQYKIQISILTEEIPDPNDPFNIISAKLHVGNQIVAIYDCELADALMHLSHEQREVILRYYFCQQTEMEIAKAIQKTQKTVSNIIKRSLKLLRKYMEDLI